MQTGHWSPAPHEHSSGHAGADVSRKRSGPLCRSGTNRRAISSPFQSVGVPWFSIGLAPGAPFVVLSGSADCVCPPLPVCGVGSVSTWAVGSVVVEGAVTGSRLQPALMTTTQSPKSIFAATARPRTPALALPSTIVVILGIRNIPQVFAIRIVQCLARSIRRVDRVVVGWQVTPRSGFGRSFPSRPLIRSARLSVSWFVDHWSLTFSS